MMREVLEFLMTGKDVQAPEGQNFHDGFPRQGGSPIHLSSVLVRSRPGKADVAGAVPSTPQQGLPGIRKKLSMPKKKKTSAIAIPDEIIEKRIYLIRRQKVMLDSDLAKLYEVPTHRLNEQVTRNLSRFPDDFMFRLTSDKW